ncbi:hypothetical protein SADUNF_Sadunf17G0129500 [Salix dunnii]|uniref:proline--tRNA ligase n=1 Tax=Salix dunnii TaxID=1413687 RepID=A0A835J7E8_9ROSI|nr:hypothetical protein SADUNF_Sadunf17G0129500 [Salix dunnii]
MVSSLRLPTLTSLFSSPSILRPPPLLCRPPHYRKLSFPPLTAAFSSQTTSASTTENPKKQTNQDQKVITPRSHDFNAWYLDIIANAELADYGPVRGTMVIRPYGYAIWEAIQDYLNVKFKETGHSNMYFPQFIPFSFIEKEASHVEGFSPELALVTIGGGKELEEKLVVRPTSETIVNHMFTQWIHSYRDLPLMWANVTRWEMRTKPFVRTLEFLWQEGHTAHANPEEAEKEALQMIDVYTKFAYEHAAIPVIAGRKSKAETFAGADRTYTIEAMMGDRKALQAGTSHNLGQNFSRAFGTQFMDENGERQHVWQTSWAVSTRFVGGIIMTHGDDSGLMLPPKIAPIQAIESFNFMYLSKEIEMSQFVKQVQLSFVVVVIVPIWKKEDEKTGVLNAASSVKNVLKSAGIKVKLDDTDQRTPGWKFNFWEMKGVPLRIEIGPRDVLSASVVISRRDVPGKQGKVLGISMEPSILEAYVKDKLDEIQSSLLGRAITFRDSNIVDVSSYDELKAAITLGKWARGPWSARIHVKRRLDQEVGKADLLYRVQDSGKERYIKDEILLSHVLSSVLFFLKSVLIWVADAVFLVLQAKSSSTPATSRKQGATASYKTLGGGSSVDGLETVGSASMMSAVGLELTNFIDPYLTWKTVTKGHRSTSRRKPVVRSFNGKAKLLDESTRNVDDMTVSDNEKYGVAVLGCRFSGKNENEHVPIKKRRHTAQAPPQPTCTTSPCFEVVEPNSSGKKRRRATDAAVPSKLNLKTSEVHDKFDYSDDFSGIEILAAVACNNGMINDAACEESLIMEESTQGVGSSSSAVPPKEIVASVKDMVHEDRPEAFQNSEVTVLHTSAGTNDSVTGEGSLLSRDEMLNLDLNVTWEQPCDTLSCDSSENDLPSCEVKPEALEQQKPSGSVVLSDLLGNNTPDDFISLSLGTCESSREEPKSEACSLHYGKHEEHFPSPTCNALEPSICDVAIAEASNQVVYGDESLDNPSCNTLPSLTLKQCSEMSSSDDQVRKVFCTESVQVESCNVSPHCQPNSERVPNEIDLSISNGNGENSQIEPCPHEDGKLNASSLENCPPTGPAWLGVDSGGQEEESGDQQYLPNRRDIYSSCLSSEKGQPMMEVDANGTNEASAANKAEAHSPVQARSEELMQKSSADSTVTPGDACETHANGFTNGSAKVNMEDLEDSFESDFYQADKVHIVGINSVELQAGYDSQFEDGELRESDAQYCWDENGEDGEVEQVDYESECDEERLHVLDNEKEMKVEIGSSSGSDYVSRKIEQCGMGDSLRDDSLSPKTRTSDVTIDKDFLSGVVGSKASNRDFLSSIEEPNAMFRKHITLRSRANSIYNLCHRDERDAGSQKFMGRDRAVPQMRDRSPGAHRSVNDAPGYCDSERRYFCTYRGNYTSGSSRTRVGFDSRRYRITSDHVVSQGAGFAGSDSRTRRRFVNPPSKSSCERITRRGSPSSRDDLYRVHTGMLPVREGSPVRSGFRRFAGGVATGGMRREYHRPMLEDKIEYPNRRMFRRERSISPLCRGQPCYPFTHKRSRSRSRSRSPYLTRDRNEARFRSRSPDFRTDARMDRVRLPFQKHIPADFEEGFIPTRRNHFTQHNPRWFDDRNGGLDGFRGRKSPVNFFRSDQRFDSVRTFRRLDPEDQFREMIRSRKLNFNDSRSASRGGEFDGSDDGRRKHNNRYEMVQRVRRYDTDGDLRRFRVNADDSLVANKVTPNCDDGNIMTDRRPGEVLRRDGEE